MALLGGFGYVGMNIYMWIFCIYTLNWFILKFRLLRIQSSFFCSVMYPSSHGAKSRELWLLLNYLANSVDGSWVLAGNFNCIINNSERSGGATISQVGYKWFREFLFDNALRDLGACGAKFT